MVFAGMALKLCQMRVLATIPFQKEHGVSNGSIGHVALALVPWLPPWKDQQKLERGLHGQNLGKGEEIE